jgi:hypothetical protein
MSDAFTKVKLTNGIVITVEPVPPFALNAVERRFVALVSGDSPESNAARASMEQMIKEAAWLMAIKDVVVPDDWTFPRGLRYAGVQPREGEDGRLLDYIEYGLLLTASDVQAVQAVMYDASLTGDELSDAEETFPANSGRETDQAYPTRSE